MYRLLNYLLRVWSLCIPSILSLHSHSHMYAEQLLLCLVESSSWALCTVPILTKYICSEYNSTVLFHTGHNAMIERWHYALYTRVWSYSALQTVLWASLPSVSASDRPAIETPTRSSSLSLRQSHSSRSQWGKRIETEKLVVWLETAVCWESHHWICSVTSEDILDPGCRIKCACHIICLAFFSLFSCQTFEQWSFPSIQTCQEGSKTCCERLQSLILCSKTIPRMQY